MKSSKRKGLLSLLAILLCVGVLDYLGYDIVDDVELGLNLAGGVSITYQVVDKNPMDEQMSDTIYKLQQRAQNYSTEIKVCREGGNRINIGIPGVSDANAVLEELGKPGSLIFMDEEGDTILTSGQVSSAKAGITKGKTGAKEYIVSLTFMDEGSKAFADATAANIGKRIAIIYNNMIYSDPTVQQAITDSQAQITGMESYETTEQLASTIRIGSPFLELQELRSNVVGAKLGQEAISTSLKATAIGFAIVAVFMIVVYLIPGLASAIALCLYVDLVSILLKTFEATLTLPGIAGIISSTGMAVDANVIIFTRIREEISLGRTMKSAIKIDFVKALSAIIDGNVTTLIAAVVLSWRGSGTVKGLASALAVGIVFSMFTALFVTKGALYALYTLGLQDAKLYGTKEDKAPINLLGKKNIYFIISCVVIVAGWAMMGVNSSSTGSILNYSMEFKGGTSTNVTFNEDMSLEDISSRIVPVVAEVTGDPEVQTQKVSGSNEVIIRTKTLSVEQRKALDGAMVEKFGVEAEKITAESISGAVSKEMEQDAMVAVVIATICALIYIWFWFKDIKSVASAVIALFHNVLVVLTFYAVAKWSVGSTFIACMLTIVGYFVNATIVIFDRIRENLKLKAGKQSLEEVVSLSIIQTFTRSINTSLTAFVMVFVLFLLGVSSICEFALLLMVGIACSTYSSVCITGALWYVLTTWKNKKRAAEKTAK